MKIPKREQYMDMIKMARDEDLGGGDVTSESTIMEEAVGRGAIHFREAGVLAGMSIVGDILRVYGDTVDKKVGRAHPTLNQSVLDGGVISAGDCVGVIEGSLRTILAAERVVLNFLQRLSGIATVTAAYVKAVEGTGAVICDTRKTTPCWRALEKFAVLCGGGVNHRAGLYDAVLIKDNHLASMGTTNLAAGLQETLNRVTARNSMPSFVEVEVDTMDQLEQVLQVEGVDMVLLDNMPPEQLGRAVALRDQAGLKGKIKLEASGNVNLETVLAIAESGVDRISVGALTHSVRALDIGLDVLDK